MIPCWPTTGDYIKHYISGVSRHLPVLSKPLRTNHCVTLPSVDTETKTSDKLSARPDSRTTHRILRTGPKCLPEAWLHLFGFDIFWETEVNKNKNISRDPKIHAWACHTWLLETFKAKDHFDRLDRLHNALVILLNLSIVALRIIMPSHWALYLDLGKLPFGVAISIVFCGAAHLWNKNWLVRCELTYRAKKTQTKDTFHWTKCIEPKVIIENSNKLGNG